MDVKEKLVEIVEKASERTLPKNTCHTNIVMLVNALIEEGVTVQEWISVNDRLPQVETPVILYGGNGITIDWLKDYGEHGLRWGNLCCGSYHPKYWQPMPQPPKGY